MELIKINETGISMFVIEHRMELVVRAGRLGLVLNYGSKIAEGTFDEIRETQLSLKLILAKGGLSLLKIENLTVAYEVAPVLHSINPASTRRPDCSTFGANGAGKSTTLKTISGLVRPMEGSVSFGGKEITKLRPDEIVELGIAHVPEGRLVFPGLTVEENLRIGSYTQKFTKRRSRRAGKRV